MAKARTALEKAQDIHNDFGTFRDGRVHPGEINYRGAIAEIGAGQEVARTMFEALGTARTIVKTMSAYAKGCSDAIYGPLIVGNVRLPYVSRARLKSMLKHDYELLVVRSLAEEEKPRGQKLRYFTFANTVEKRHGWAGVRLQTTGDSLELGEHEIVEYRVHFNVLAEEKVAFMEVTGMLGINLIHSALLHGGQMTMSDKDFVVSLMDNIVPSAIRIDAIEVERLSFTFSSHTNDKPKEVVTTTEPSVLAETRRSSREMNIEIVKNSLSHCVCFLPDHNQYGSATYSYDSFDFLSEDRLKTKRTPRPLLITRSSCETVDLSLESEMFQSAKQLFLKDIRNECGLELLESDISTAIQLPVLSAADKQFHPDVYIDRDREPSEHKIKRIEMLANAENGTLAERIDRINKSGSVAILTEFIATSELVKFLRQFTRLALQLRPTQEATERASSPTPRNIGFVVRSDQFVEMLLNFSERFKDRHAMEVIGNLVRRDVRIYLYPCTYDVITSSETRYGLPLLTAFSRKDTEVMWKKGNYATVASLKDDLDEKYSSLIRILDEAKAIRDIKPMSTPFCHSSRR